MAILCHIVSRSGNGPWCCLVFCGSLAQVRLGHSQTHLNILNIYSLKYSRNPEEFKTKKLWVRFPTCKFQTDTSCDGITILTPNPGSFHTELYVRSPDVCYKNIWWEIFTSLSLNQKFFTPYRPYCRILYCSGRLRLIFIIFLLVEKKWINTYFQCQKSINLLH